MAHHLGRETYLAPVAWSEAGWPVVNGNGTITPRMQVKTLPPDNAMDEPARDDFSAARLDLVWNSVRNLEAGRWSLKERAGWLRLKGSAFSLADAESAPVFLGRRQQFIDGVVG